MDEKRQDFMYQLVQSDINNSQKIKISNQANINESLYVSIRHNEQQNEISEKQEILKEKRKSIIKKLIKDTRVNNKHNRKLDFYKSIQNNQSALNQINEQKIQQQMNLDNFFIINHMQITSMKLYNERANKLKKAKLFNQRKRNFWIITFWICTGIIMFFNVLIKEEFFQNYDLGILCFNLICLFLFCNIIIYLNIVHNKLKPKNDPGILIWWMFCIRIGKKSKNNSRRIEKAFSNENQNSQQNEYKICCFLRKKQSQNKKLMLSKLQQKIVNDYQVSILTENKLEQNYRYDEFRESISPQMMYRDDSGVNNQQKNKYFLSKKLRMKHYFKNCITEDFCPNKLKISILVFLLAVFIAIFFYQYSLQKELNQFIKKTVYPAQNCKQSKEKFYNETFRCTYINQYNCVDDARNYSISQGDYNYKEHTNFKEFFIQNNYSQFFINSQKEIKRKINLCIDANFIEISKDESLSIYNFGKRSLIVGFYDLFAVWILNSKEAYFDEYFEGQSIDRSNIYFVRIFGIRKFNCQKGINFLFCYFQTKNPSDNVQKFYQCLNQDYLEYGSQKKNESKDSKASELLYLYMNKKFYENDNQVFKLNPYVEASICSKNYNLNE